MKEVPFKPQISKVLSSRISRPMIITLTIAVVVMLMQRRWILRR
jgi:hypothetical protein